MMFLDLDAELKRLLGLQRIHSSDEISRKLVEMRAKFEVTRTASFHRPHGCLVLPCATCRGQRPTDD